MTNTLRILPPRHDRKVTRRRRRRIAASTMAIVALMGAGMFLYNMLSEAEAQQPAQGWSNEERLAWYRGTQGSRLLPQRWFEALEQPGSTEMFASMANLESLGFVSPPSFDTTPWPIGFAVDRQDDSAFRVTGLRWYEGQLGDDDHAEPWVGLNCSACHTARITVGDQARIIDGAPGMLDFQSFVEQLNAALVATVDDPEKWDRFAARVLDGRLTDENIAMLRTAVDQMIIWQKQTETLNATDLRYGFGRLDAVGHILNKIQMYADTPNPIPSPANAPVSIPYLWNIWKQERVQWNGVARNSRFALPGDDFEYGALGRNTGEVLGVFGEVMITPHEATGDLITGYTSSVRTENLMRMELLLQRLEPPKWPTDIAPIDAQLANVGARLYRRNCASCHLLAEDQFEGEPTERMALFTATSPENQTDIWMACNTWAYAGPSGLLEGTPDINMEPLLANAPLAAMLATTVRGTILGSKADLIREGFNNFLGIQKRPVIDRTPEPGDPLGAIRRACLTTPDVPILAYKARPLDGIWATAPYLHNGSVQTLAELLLPADQRQAQFLTGSDLLNPGDVGFVTTEDDPRRFLLRTEYDGRPIEGNSRAGHDYGVAQLSDDDRQALLEFLKTL